LLKELEQIKETLSDVQVFNVWNIKFRFLNFSLLCHRRKWNKAIYFWLVQTRGLTSGKRNS
jgi:hypothetical protein